MKSNRLLEIWPGRVAIRPSSIASVQAWNDWPTDSPRLRICLHGGQEFYVDRPYAEFMALINALEGV